MNRFRLTLAATALGLMALPAAAAIDIATGDSSLGPVLTDARGMTLYTFDKDAGGTSACYDQCAANWPPLVAPAGAEGEGDYGLTERSDGTMQWTYDGSPLYLWVKDQKPGDVTGEGINGVWHVARPD